MIDTFLKIYQNSLSGLLVILFGRGCRFVPTCSDYARDALKEYGIMKGTYLALKRVGKCHPWGSFGYDPLPPRK